MMAASIDAPPARLRLSLLVSAAALFPPALGIASLRGDHGMMTVVVAPPAAEADVGVVRIPLDDRDVAALVQATKSEAAIPEIPADQARRINAALPFSATPVEASRPLNLSNAPASDRHLALKCLTQAIYYEAGFEPVEGRRAVAQVVLNRLRHPAFPKTVCGVVYEGASRPGCQFSFTCDGSLRRVPSAGAWAAAEDLAREALAGRVSELVGHATHYHTDWVAPYWAPRLTKIRQIGAHIFYRWPGAWGRERAFNGAYAGGETLWAAPAWSADADAVAAAGTPVVQDPTDRRAENDVGGRLDVSKGWTLSIPAPAEAGGSLNRMVSAQAATAPAKALALNEKPGGDP